MKTPEDEAFDELTGRQGDWGSGFQIKLWNENEWRKNNWRCGHGWLRGEQCEICNAPQPAKEPFGYFKAEPFGWIDCAETDEGAKALYEAEPKRKWVGLTDDELADIWYKESLDWMEFARAHEAALKEKNFD